jgi:hypothetical protein
MSFLDKYLAKKSLKESREFEEFIKAHRTAWDQHDKMRQAAKLGIDLPDAKPAPQLHFSMDDLGGREVINQLERSRTPEADLGKMIAAAERSGNRELADNLTSFKNEFALQRGLILKGLETSFKNTGSVGHQNKGKEDYMTPMQTAEKQSAPEFAPIATEKQPGEDEGSHVIGRPVGKGGHANIAQSARDYVSAHAGTAEANQVQSLLDQKKKVNSEANLSPEQKKSKRDALDQQLEKMISAAPKTAQKQPDKEVATSLDDFFGNKPAAGSAPAPEAGKTPGETMTPMVDKQDAETIAATGQAPDKKIADPWDDKEEPAVSPNVAAAAAAIGGRKDSDKKAEPADGDTEQDYVAREVAKIGSIKNKKKRAEVLRGRNLRQLIKTDFNEHAGPEASVKFAAAQDGLTHAGYGLFGDDEGLKQKIVDGKRVDLTEQEQNTIEEYMVREAYIDAVGKEFNKLENAVILSKALGIEVLNADGSLKDSKEDFASPAAAEAYRRGLQHIGFGLYADLNGNVVAKTVDGQLVMLSTEEAQQVNRFKEQLVGDLGSFRKGKDEKKAKTGKKRGQKAFRLPNPISAALNSRKIKVDDSGRKINPFSKKANHDPALAAAVEMASKRISNIRSKMKDLINQLKKEKNPIIKERLQQMLNSLDRQLGVAYVALERLKGVSDTTTSADKVTDEEMHNLFQDAEKLSVDAARETGGTPAVWQAASLFSQKTGKKSALDSLTSEKDKGGETATPERSEFRTQMQSKDFKFDAELADELEQEWDNFDEPTAEGELDTVSSKSSGESEAGDVFNLGDIKGETPEEKEARLAKVESEAEQRRQYEAEYAPPRGEEKITHLKKKNRAKRKRQRERAIQKVYDDAEPYLQKLSVARKLAMGSDDKKQIENMTAQLLGTMIAAADYYDKKYPLRGSVNDRKRIYFDKDINDRLDRKMNILNTVSNDNKVSEAINSNLEKLADDEERLFFKWMVTTAALGDPKNNQGKALTKFGEDLVKHAQRHNSPTNNDATRFFASLRGASSRLADTYFAEPVKGNNDMPTFEWNLSQTHKDFGIDPVTAEKKRAYGRRGNLAQDSTVLRLMPGMPNPLIPSDALAKGMDDADMFSNYGVPERDRRALKSGPYAGRTLPDARTGSDALAVSYYNAKNASEFMKSAPEFDSIYSAADKLHDKLTSDEYIAKKLKQQSGLDMGDGKKTEPMSVAEFKRRRLEGTKSFDFGKMTKEQEKEYYKNRKVSKDVEDIIRMAMEESFGTNAFLGLAARHLCEWFIDSPGGQIMMETIQLRKDLTSSRNKFLSEQYGNPNSEYVNAIAECDSIVSIAGYLKLCEMNGELNNMSRKQSYNFKRSRRIFSENNKFYSPLRRLEYILDSMDGAPIDENYVDPLNTTVLQEQKMTNNVKFWEAMMDVCLEQLEG